MNTLRISDIVDNLKSYEQCSHISKKDMVTIIEGTFAVIQEEVLKDNEVSVNNFGKFVKITREGTIQSNFAKNKKFKSSRVAFKPFSSSKIKG